VLMNTIATVAAPRSHSESPFVLPSAVPTWWQSAVSSSAERTGVLGSGHRIRSNDPKLTTVDTATMAGADARVATKQDRPPRGVPR
jgi:hypothetical protein